MSIEYLNLSTMLVVVITYTVLRGMKGFFKSMCYDSCFMIQKLLNIVNMRSMPCPWLIEVRKFPHLEKLNFCFIYLKAKDFVY